MDAWFLSFLWRRPDPDSNAWHPVEAVTEVHPLDYMALVRDSSPQHEFCLLFFAPIARDVYVRHQGA